MFWRILPHATLCRASDGIILLDIRQDRYFMVPDAITGLMSDWLRATPAVSAPVPVLDMLRRGGIALPDDPDAVPVMHDSVDVSRSLLDSPDGVSPSNARDRMRVAALVTSTWLRLRLCPLQRLLEERPSPEPCSQDAVGDLLRARARAFDASRRFTPFDRNCLLDSLALAGWFARDRLDHQLVFGVTARPFAAHCWLQSGHEILNDSYDRVSRFSPILAL